MDGWIDSLIEGSLERRPRVDGLHGMESAEHRNEHLRIPYDQRAEVVGPMADWTSEALEPLDASKLRVILDSIF